jgi:FHA domain-containing protein
MVGETHKIDREKIIRETAVPEIRAIDLGMPRPWRIALRLVQLQMEMIFDLESTIIIGRAHPDTGFYPDIDLGAFGGGEQGVSREHLFFQLDGERVIIVDKNSANGTRLNGEWLKPNEAYLVRHGDELTLGLMKLQVELLIDPFHI